MENAPDTESGFLDRAKQPIAGTAKSGGQRQGHPKQSAGTPLAIRVSVAVSDRSTRGERVPRYAIDRAQSVASALVTGRETAAILGTGSGKRHPWPSSRETATPPCWARDRGGEKPRSNRLCDLASPLASHAEGTEAGPGRDAGCPRQKNEYLRNKRNCGHPKRNCGYPPRT
jgi:hypothetical protein